MGHAGGQVRRFSHRDGHVNGQNAATGQQRVCVVGGTKRRGGGVVPRMDGRHERRRKQTTNKEQPATARTAPQNCTASYRSAPFKDGDTSGLCSLLREEAGGGGVRGAESALAASRSTSSVGIRTMWTWFPPRIGTDGHFQTTREKEKTSSGSWCWFLVRPTGFTHPAWRPKPPVAVAVAVAAMMLVWSDRGQWEKKDGRWAPVARPYHVR